jgi:hypothetical protein
MAGRPRLGILLAVRGSLHRPAPTGVNPVKREAWKRRRRGLISRSRVSFPFLLAAILGLNWLVASILGWTVLSEKSSTAWRHAEGADG